MGWANRLRFGVLGALISLSGIALIACDGPSGTIDLLPMPDPKLPVGSKPPPPEPPPGPAACATDDPCPVDAACEAAAEAGPSCGACSGNADCGKGPKPICDMAKGLCVECVSDMDCGPGKTCNAPQGRCQP